MLTATLSPVSNRADWIDAYGLYDIDTEDPIDVSSATEITVSIRDASSQAIILTATLSDGSVDHIEDGVFQWSFSASSMRNLCAKTYEVGCTIEIDDQTIQLLIGQLPVVDGIVS